MPKPPSDEEIVALFFVRDESAIRYTEKKYKNMILSICVGLLSDSEEAEECCNSVLFDVWQKIPPERPHSLAAFLSKIARRTAIDRIREKTRKKRADAHRFYSSEELSELLVDSENVEREIEQKELSLILDRFLSDLTPEKRRLFLLRYYAEKTLDEIGKLTCMSKQGVAWQLKELRERLKTLLEKEGYL